MSLGSGALSRNVIWLRALHEHGLALPFSESYLTSARKASKMVVFSGPSQSGKSVTIKHLLQSHAFRTPEVHQSAMLNASYVLEAFCSRWNSHITSTQSAAIQYSFLFDDQEVLVGGKVRFALLDVEKVLSSVSATSVNESTQPAQFSFDVLHSLVAFAKKCGPFAQKFGLSALKSGGNALVPLSSSSSSSPSPSSTSPYRYVPDVGDAAQLLPAYDELLGVLQSVFGVDEREQQLMTKLLAAVILIGNLNTTSKSSPISSADRKDDISSPSTVEPIEKTNRTASASPFRSPTSSPSTSPSRLRNHSENILSRDAEDEKRRKVCELLGLSAEERRFLATTTETQLHWLASAIYSRVVKWVVRKMNQRLTFATKQSSSSSLKSGMTAATKAITFFSALEIPSPSPEDAQEHQWMEKNSESSGLHSRILRLALRLEQTATQQFLHQDGVTVPEEVRRAAIDRINELLHLKERTVSEELLRASNLLSKSTNQILVETRDAKVSVGAFCDKIELFARSSDCLFMRCVPPPSAITSKQRNESPQRGSKENDSEFQRFVGAFDSIGIGGFAALRQELYPFRMSHKRLASSFGPAKAQTPSADLSKLILERAGANPVDFLVGKTRVYLRADALQLLRTASLNEEIEKHKEFLSRTKKSEDSVPTAEEISFILRPLPIPYTPSDPDHQNTIQSTVTDVKEVLQSLSVRKAEEEEAVVAASPEALPSSPPSTVEETEAILSPSKKPVRRKLLFDEEREPQMFQADSDNTDDDETKDAAEENEHEEEVKEEEEKAVSSGDDSKGSRGPFVPSIRERSNSAWERAVPRGKESDESVSSAFRPSVQLQITKMLATASESHHDIQNKERMVLHLQSLLASVSPHRIGTEGSKPELLFHQQNSLSPEEVSYFYSHFPSCRPLLESLRIIFEYSSKNDQSLLQKEVIQTFCANVVKNFNFSLANYSQSGSSVLTVLREIGQTGELSAVQLVSMMLLWRICQALLTICTRDSSNPSSYPDSMAAVRESGVLTALISALLTRVHSFAALLRDTLLHHNIERICIEILKSFTGRGDTQETNCLWIVSHSLFWPLVQHISSLILPRSSSAPPSAIGSGISESDQKSLQLNSLVVLTNITSVPKCVLLLQQQKELERGSQSVKTENAGEKCLERTLVSLLFGTAPHDSRAALRALRLIRQCSNLLFESLLSSGILFAILKQVPIRGVEYVQDAAATVFALHSLPIKRNRVLSDAVAIGALQVFVQSLIRPSKDIREKSALALCNFCSRNITSDHKSNLRKVEDLLGQMVRIASRASVLAGEEDASVGVTSAFTRLAKDVTKTNLQSFLVQLWTALDQKTEDNKKNASSNTTSISASARHPLQNQIQNTVIPLRTPTASPAKGVSEVSTGSAPPSAPSSPSLLVAGKQKLKSALS